MLIVYETIESYQKHLACEDLYNDEFEINRCNTVGLSVEYASQWLA